MSLALMLWSVSLICLVPLGLYLLWYWKDPFHPLVFVGTLAFFVACYQPLTNLDPALIYVTRSQIFYYETVVGFCMLALYAGYWMHWRRSRQRMDTAGPADTVLYKPSGLMGWGIFLSVVGVASYLYTRTDYDYTGYVRVWGLVWFSGIILIMQAVLLNRTYLSIGIVFIALDLVPPIDRFFIYGQRGDTFRLALLAVPLFLFYGRRPLRSIFIPAAICLAMVLSVLETTRGMVEEGAASNRVEALIHVLPNFFTQKVKRYEGTEDFIYGSVMIDTVRVYGNYNYGRSVTDLVVRFLPKEFFDKTKYYSPWSRMFATDTASDAAGYQISRGSYASGFAHVFVEFWWLSLGFWVALGYWIRHRYVAAIHSPRLDQQAYFATMYIVLLYLITQDMNEFMLDLLLLNGVLWIAYRFSRVIIPADERMAMSLMHESDPHAPITGWN